MKIKTKLGFLLVISAIFIYGLSAKLLSNTFKDYQDNDEKTKIQTSENLAFNFIEDNLNDVDDFSTGWGYWTETYNYINGEYDDYPELELTPNYLLDYGVDMSIILDIDGKLIYSHYFDFETSEYSEIDAKTLEAFHAFFKESIEPNEYFVGITKLNDQFFYLSSTRVQDSNYIKEPNGFFVAAKKIDKNELEKFPFESGYLTIEDASENITLDAKTYYDTLDDTGNGIFKDDYLKSRFFTYQNTFMPYNIEKNSSNIEMTYLIINDVNHNEVISVKLVTDRISHKLGILLLEKITKIFMILLISLFLIVYFGFNVMLTSPLSKMIHELKQVDFNNIRKSKLSKTKGKEMNYLKNTIDEMLSNISDKQDELIWNEAKLHSILSSVTGGIITIDLYGKIDFVNKTALKLLNLEEPKGIELFDLLKKYSKLSQDDFYKSIEYPTSDQEVLILPLVIDDDEKFFKYSISDVVDQKGKCVGQVFAFNDFTDSFNYQKNIEYLGYYDSLTGVHNRNFFDVKVEELKNKLPNQIGVIFADLNDLKAVNDTYGHETGDALICGFANIIKNNMLGNNVITRIGGDEFVIIIENHSDAELTEYIDRLKDLFNNTKINGIQLSVSFGFASNSSGENDIAKLINSADRMMYSEKRLKNRVFKK